MENIHEFYAVTKDGYTIPLKWTPDPPKEPGWYWVIDGFVIEIGRADIKDRKIQMVGTDELCNFSEIEYWLGPLPLPDPPEK